LADSSPIWPLLLYIGGALAVVAGMLGISFLLGQRHRDRYTDEPFEGGLISAGAAPLKLRARYYLVAMFFVVFDLEAVFLVAWALVARELGWSAYWAVVVFVGVLGVAIVYLWRIGALDWGTSARQNRRLGGAVGEGPRP
jgi:NADH-quinone oxidoreductase subunit A